jgi:hypothetical protein
LEAEVHALHARNGPRPTAVVLGILILLGSLMLVAIPIGWLWLLSQMGQPYLAIYFLALAGCPIMMVAWGLLLIRMNRAYMGLTGGRDDAGALLEISIVLSVVIAIALMAAWLFLFPHGGGPVRGPWPS